MMNYRIACLPLLILTALCLRTTAEDKLPPAATAQVDFDKQILPLLKSKCFDCHGKDTQESQLRLDLKARMLRGGNSGEPAIIVGNSAESHLIKLVAGLERDTVMPPDEDERLTPTQIGLLRAWIDQGANWPGPAGVVEQQQLTTDHWSFQPLTNVAPPQLDDPWIRNGIDAFILQKQREMKLTHQSEAKRNVLIRRVYLDMLGLPPSPERVEAFAAETDPDAYDRLVDEVLDSPHYGERWARYWLDLVRFAETYGFETNRERPNAWPYRDYVIQSLNDDKPYDQFIREQIAGDAFGAPVGTAYLVAGPYDQVKSPDVNLTLMQRQNELDDIINTTGTAFLGLTIGCARCHNHKFDPITQRDYYSWQAIFAGVQHGDRALPLHPEQQEQLATIEARIRPLEEQLAKYRLRDPVNAKHNVDRFPPVTTRRVRFRILATNSSQPCIDELEIFSGDENVALASAGAMASCSSSLPGYAIHKLEHVNDGKYGNSHSWISNEPGAGWVQIDFPEPKTIDRVEWARDREQKYKDRVATQYAIDVATPSGEWKTVAGNEDRIPFGTGVQPAARYRINSGTQEEQRQARTSLTELEQLSRRREKLAATQTVYAGTFAQPGPTHRLYRGDPTAKREQITPDTLEVMASLDLPADTPERERRKALAEWIASPQNPLTPRVIVNRLWQFHFGRGLVDTPSDFGAGGVPPTHPELLDWLARQLIDGGWSLKHIHRLILTSAAYRQSSRPIADNLTRDAANAYLWRFAPRRLEAEPIRDCILSVTGSLDLRAGGPGFSAFEVEQENVRHYHPKTSYGPGDWRRMIYMTKVRQEQDSVFGPFDCPDAANSVAKRSRSTTPLQALNLFNSTFILQQADRFAARLQKEHPHDLPAQIERAWLLAFSRRPTPNELTDTQSFVKSQGLPALCRALLNSNEFLFLQ